jgi:hypothetical protein
MTFDYFNLKSHKIFEFTNDREKIFLLWALKQEMNILANMSLYDYRDFHDISRKIASIEREGANILKNE